MNIKELRIGNRVFCNRYYTVESCLIYSIKNPNVQVSDNMGGSRFITIVHPSKLEAMPITENFIAENFTKFEATTFDLKGSGYLVIEDGKFYVILGGFSGLKKEVKFVHELQNIVFDLTEIEI